MTAPAVAPYGAWTSPISAAALAQSGHPVEGGAYVGSEIWWAELRAAEAGRIAIRRIGPDGPVDVLWAPWNARSRVHEYGGGAWATRSDGALVFVEYRDQRLYLLAPGADEPTALTPDPPQPAAWRYAELQLIGDEVLCVRERHTGDAVERDIAAVPLDGSAATEPAAIRSVVGGSHFLAAPRISPNGARLAWIAWEHPQMPWDGTELRVADLGADGRSGPHRTLLGGPTESVLQPEWLDNERLYTLSDRSGFWNLYQVAVSTGELRALCPREQDFGGPLWTLGSGWYRPLADGRLLTVRTRGTDAVGILDPNTGELRDLDLGVTALGRVDLGPVDGQHALAVLGGADAPAGLREIDLTTGSTRAIRLAVEELPPAGYLPEPRPMTFAGPGGRDVHAVVYPPRNPDFVGPAGERPPYVAFVHGGPTAHVAPAVSVLHAYFTSRGIGIVDVNYGGSTGYGRAYRERLRGQWGVVDVEDTVAAIRGVADAGLADAGRLAVEGGSAGGWTVLAALTSTDAFACGVSYFGVAELAEFVKETHDFESRYIDGLIGPLPEARELYERRAPLNRVADLSCPVLLLQGLDDPIVPPAQAERFRDALRAKGIPHAYLAFEGESHGFRKAETIIAAREAELSFYGQIFGFEPPGVAQLRMER